jgi:hypothetical protein
MLSEAAPKDSTDRARVATVVVAPPAWDLEAVEVSVVEEGAVEVVGADGADSGPTIRNTITGAPI